MEVLYNGTWGTICDDSWDIRDAEVVCRQLGYESALEALSNASFGEGSADMPIWLDNVICYGTEVTITDCLYEKIGQQNCQHSEDVGVRCYCEWRHTYTYTHTCLCTHTRTRICTHILHRHTNKISHASGAHEPP